MQKDQNNMPKVPTALVKHGGKEYKWKIAAFKLPGSKETLIASEVSEDSFILDRILEIEGQGLLVEQV